MSESTGIRFADFKCAQSDFIKTPDVILKDNNHVLKVAGELRVPWIRKHYDNESQLRKIDLSYLYFSLLHPPCQSSLPLYIPLSILIASHLYLYISLSSLFLASHMQKLGCVYGFLSNHDEIIFLWQLIDNQGTRRIEYSPVIKSWTAYDRDANPPVVSTRQGSMR